MSETKPKEPLLAVLLSFLLTGLGQMYAGRAKRGLALLLISIVCVIAAFAYVLPPNTKLHPILLLLILPVLAFALFVIIDAYRCARTWNIQHHLTRKITAGKRVAFIFGILVVPIIPGPEELVARYIRDHVVAPYKMPAGSMRPALMEEDRLLVDKTIYRRSEPRRGDIMVFKYPDDPKRLFIKRLVGLPGETVEIRDERIVINGSMLQASLGRWVDVPYYNQGKYAEKGQVVTVPAGHYFVLGDNSASSHDSRFWGFVPKQNLIGKAYKIFWPPDRSGALE
jgi:signal peptidase I